MILTFSATFLLTSEPVNSVADDTEIKAASGLTFQSYYTRLKRKNSAKAAKEEWLWMLLCSPKLHCSVE